MSSRHRFRRHMHAPCVAGACALALLAAGSGAHAAIQERVLHIPVEAQSASGKLMKAHIAVTVFSDPANPVPAPVAVINHGRSPGAEGRKELHRARFARQARYFVSRGFIVAVPTRMGYGPTFEDDAEDSGGCRSKHYEKALNSAARQIDAALKAVRRLRGDASPDRAVIVGQSFGAAASVAAAALEPEGAQAVVSFAGGAGGNPRTHPAQPCDPQQMAQVFRDFGGRSQVPMLWVYAKNDQFFGAQWPVKWHTAFVEGGGRAEFRQLPPFGADGHALFHAGIHRWRPVVSEFLDASGFALPAPMPRGMAGGVAR
ncbi:dienelactone hydrolase family protein [Diaphorobacter ruginosibacter]|uniref:dienelactone hydrolase family protein n=1 Tax=Diaphorobacter ruginosibacter TaxID=1715720 RepID=UPI00333E9FBD